MKFYTISSTEYEANLPDFFIMDADGNYYGVFSPISYTSYAQFYKFPKDVNFWRTAEGSDAGRHFIIDEVDIDESLVHEFEAVTREYEAVKASTPEFEKTYPSERNFRTKRAYKQAEDAWWAEHAAWCKKVNMPKYMNKREQLLTRRVVLFIGFSEKQRNALSRYHYYREICSNHASHV